MLWSHAPHLSTRDIRQIITYRDLLPKLKGQGEILSQNKKIRTVALRNLDACHGPYWEEAYKEFMEIVENDDYDTLYKLLTSEEQEHERYRVISPLITIYRELVQRDPNRIHFQNVVVWKGKKTQD